MYKNFATQKAALLVKKQGSFFVNRYENSWAKKYVHLFIRDALWRISVSQRCFILVLQ